MKQFLLVLLAIACGAVLVMGNHYWQERTKLKAATNVETKSAPTEALKQEEEEKEQVAKDLTANWPDAARETYQQKVEEGTPFKIVIMGSPALGASEGGWAPQLKESLLSAYDDTIEVSILEWDTTSVEFVNSSDVDIALDGSPDLVLWEPFNLVDNSNRVGPVQNHESILIFDRKLHEANDEATLILQPPHPILKATYYPSNIEDLKTFAGDEGIPYLDHWGEWPEDDALTDYLVEDQDTPNAKGYTLWKDYLVDYFIAD